MAVEREQYDLTNDDDDEVPVVAPQKKRRFSLEVEPIVEESPRGRGSERIAKNEKEKEKIELQKKLAEADRVTSSLFKSLKQLNAALTTPKTKLRNCRKALQS